MAYTETRTVGYGSRVGNSFKAIGGGFLLFILGTALLWWNEGRAVKTEKMLNEAGNAYVEMENPNKKDASLEGELICGTAMATTEDSLTDAQFGIGAKAIAIKRIVEYYQWVEHAQEKKEDKLGGKEVTTTTYTYSKEWVSRPIESAQFKDPAYQNKNMMLNTIDDAEQYAENVSFGAYKLSESLIHSISSSEGLDLAIAEDLLKQFDKNTQAAYERFYGVQKKEPAQQPTQQPAIPDSVKALLPDSVKAVLDSLQAVNDSIVKSMENAENKKDLEYVHQASNVLYFGRVPGSPEVGDVRVTFEKIVPAKVTVMAVVDGNSLGIAYSWYRDGHWWFERNLRLHRDNPKGCTVYCRYLRMGCWPCLYDSWHRLVSYRYRPCLVVLSSDSRNLSLGFGWAPHLVFCFQR